MTEASRKIEKVRELLKKQGAYALRLRGVDWFAWATGGGDGSVIFSSEVGVAEVFITAERSLVLTNAIERERLAIEEVPREFELMSFPWIAEHAADEFRQAEARGRTVISDRPCLGETAMNEEWMALKLHLSTRELARYQELGSDAARAATEALRQARPDMTEWQVAGLAAQALWSRGIHPMLTMVGGESRVARYRHPVATSAKIGTHAMLVICGRRQGLYANLTRHVYFRKPTQEEYDRAHDVAMVEAEAFRATEELRPLPDIYRRLKTRYAELGYPNEIEKHHQGGPTGYLSREEIARPQGSLGLRTETHMAFAWNPSLPAAKIEDTVFLGADQRLIVLTCDPEWPMIDIDGRKRPDLLVRT